MSEQNTADNWRLEDTGDTLDQWKLQEGEQTQAEQWQLQRLRPNDIGWQPVDYERQGPRRGSWVLPLLVGLALVAVFAYGVWIGLGTLGITDISSLIAPVQTTPTALPEVALAEQDATATALAAVPTEEPTATATVAPTETAAPTPSPTPESIKVEQQIVRITNQYGVNARREPSTNGELVEVLQQGQEFVVTEDRGDGWLQVALPSAQLVWISSDFAEKRSELIPLEIANQRRSALGLEPLTEADAFTGTLAVATVAPTPVTTEPLTGTQALTETVAVTTATPTTATAQVTSTIALTTSAPPAAVTEITGTVLITAGLNARSAPTTTAQAVVLLNGGAVLTITGRSADSQWLQVRLSDGTLAWVFAEFVEISPTSAPAPVATPSATTPVTTTTETSPTGGGASASVKSLSGANARLAPDRNADSAEVIAYDTVLAVRGRTANNEWLQVEYQGKQLWVLVSTVSLSVDLATLPVVNP